MFDQPGQANDKKEGDSNSFQVRAPAVALPKGGGAIRGIGEKFAANPVTGTGSMTVPIATSLGRSGFGPQLSLSYDSGAGNGIFGFGWSLSLPAITRKTDKGLPKYQDADESDVFILSGAEDLVPVLIEKGGKWGREQIPPRTINGKTYHIQGYRPRIEGLFARIERWTNQADATDTFWRSISKDNITTWYGKTEESRIADPADLTRIFSWLICESYDDKGNVIVYGYEREKPDNVDVSQAHERNRTHETRSANRYLKRIRYGNHDPYLPKLLPEKPWPAPPGNDQWFFEVVFDYGEHDLDTPLPTEPGKKWPFRNDPFSSYRAGFEMRTYRLCQRVLMFHHFPGEAEVGRDCLVRSTDFAYSYEKTPADPRNPIYSFLLAATQTGYKRKLVGYLSKSLPPLEFQYTQPEIDETVQEIDRESLENLPYGLDGTRYQWVDLDGEGVSGILTEQAEGWFYKRNLSPINLRLENGKETPAARFSPVELVARKPSLAALSSGRQQFLDLAGDGQLDVVELDSPTPGFYERTEDEDWEPFRPFASLPVLDWNNPNLKFVDLTGDGHADLLISEDEAFCWHASLAEAGFGPSQRVLQALDEEKGPKLVFADSTQTVFLADLSGDGLTDLARIRNVEVCYWPNLGYGRFGAKVTMDHSPWFEASDLFDGRRIRLADIDGSGTTDIIYLASAGVQLYFNQSGNGWGEQRALNRFPLADSSSSVTALDLLGNGTACLAWSSPLPGNAREPVRYINLMGGQKPHLLISTKNNLGAETHVQYAPSTKFHLADKLAGKPWITKLPFAVHVVEKVTAIDQWRKTSFSSTYSYHHGYFDGIEREFRGFGRVEQVDAESYGKFEQGNPASPYITDDKTLYQPPVKTVTWYHTGAFLDRERILSHFEHEYFPRWLEEKHPDLKIPFKENELPQPDLAAEDLNAEEWREALRACKGMTLRQEVYELDVDALEKGEHSEVKLFSTAYHNCHIQRLQAKGSTPMQYF
jgi:virulence plasmid B protein/glycosyltransferase TcdB-like subunit of Tc toxin